VRGAGDPSGGASALKRRIGLLAGRVLASAAAVFVALALCELAVRVHLGLPLLPLVPPEPYLDNSVLYVPSPTRLYELRPGVDAVVSRRQIRIHVNAQGQRDDVDRATAKPPGVLRVVVLGDSFTFGGKVPLDETFSRSLERRLGALDETRRAEVVNLAVPGYNTEQEVLSLKESGLAYDPDVVVVNFVLNDAGRMVQLIQRASRLPAALHRALKRSDLVQLVYAKVKYLRYLERGGARREADKYGEFADGNPRWEATRAALVEIQRLAAAHGARVLVAVWPMLVDLGPDYPHRDKHAFIVRECERAGIPVLDLLPVFEGRDASALWAARDDHHPNGAALALAADAVARDLERRGILAGTKPLA
jgi:GDSL-like lipase/acylhydrolase family protein